jgi:hypothetical protein
MMRRKKKPKSCKPQEDERQRKAHEALEKLGAEAAREILAFEIVRQSNKGAKAS